MKDPGFVRQQFARSDVLDSYDDLTNLGLWRSEELLLAKYLRRPSRVLDIGCGTGRMAIALARRGHDAIGIDFVPEMVLRARDNATLFQVDSQFQVADATALPYPDDTFDFVTFAYSGLNNIPKENRRTQALTEARRVLRPGGFFMFSSHVRDKHDGLDDYWANQLTRIATSPVEAEEEGDRVTKRYGRTQYINLPTMPHLKAQLTKAGFVVVFAGDRDVLAPDEPTKIRYRTDLFVCLPRTLRRDTTLRNTKPELGDSFGHDL